MKPIIEVKGLSKRYKLGVFNAKTLREEAEALLARFSRRKGDRRSEMGDRGQSSISQLLSPSEQSSDFWALRDVSFEVQPGEVIGIIGRNGAGKSTLLKILSRITEPTSGEARIRGRVASLLEVGTGFHPELSGRENIFLNGAILGMTKQEIRNKFDEIVAFAEIEKFIDTPVKRYSSGMYVRLAFAVAAHLEPEILIVDEVLAVGDAEFQKKCLGKMKQVSAGDGRTVLFVSHQMGAVMNLCSRALLLEHGNLTFSGETTSVVDHYMSSSRTSSPRARLAQCQFLRSAGFAKVSGDPLRAAFPVGGVAQVQIELSLPEASRKPVAGIVGRRAGTGETVFGANSRSSGQRDLGRATSTARVEVELGPLSLVPGHYLLDVWVGHDHEDLEVSEGLLELEILDNDPQGTGRPVLTQFGPCFVPMRYDARESS